jgi:DNA-binding XRE family transcriptional regulator
MKNRLKELRQLHQWSQADLARKLGISRQSVNGFESEKFDPSLEMALKIASLFNVAIEEIFIYGETDTMPTFVDRVQNFIDQNFGPFEAGVMTAEELLQRYTAGERDFSGLNLIRLNVGGDNPLGANLNGINLSGSNLSESDLTKINLSEANLSGADLSQCLLKNANLSGANLSGANLSNTLVSGSNLTGADLTSANLMNTAMTKVNLTDANLTNAHFCNTAIGSYS